MGNMPSKLIGENVTLEPDGGQGAFMLEPQTINSPFAGEYRLGESADGMEGV